MAAVAPAHANPFPYCQAYASNTPASFSLKPHMEDDPSYWPQVHMHFPSMPNEDWEQDEGSMPYCSLADCQRSLALSHLDVPKADSRAVVIWSCH